MNWSRREQPPNKSTAPNSAMTSLFQSECYWRGIGEPER
jgi:hypothetical protein